MSSNIPNFVHEEITRSNGMLTDAWGLWFDQLINVLQSQLSNEGFLLPTLTSTQVAMLDPSISVNRLFITSDTNHLIVNINGSFITIV